jgi:hypothetical protein
VTSDTGYDTIGRYRVPVRYWVRTILGRFWVRSCYHRQQEVSQLFSTQLKYLNSRISALLNSTQVFQLKYPVKYFNMASSTEISRPEPAPAIASRVTIIVDSAAQPLGRVSDVWMRTEFQGRLIDHIHAMVAISSEKPRPGSIHEHKRSLPDIMET